MSVLGQTRPDRIAQILGTGYERFNSLTGVDGLAKVNGDRLDVLAVHTPEPFQNRGCCREFVRQAKEQYCTVCIWHVDNQTLAGALKRYGFTPETEIQSDGEIVPGWRWDKP